MKAGRAAKLIVDALLQRFLPLARRRIETTQAQVVKRQHRHRPEGRQHIAKPRLLPLAIGDVASAFHNPASGCDNCKGLKICSEKDPDMLPLVLLKFGKETYAYEQVLDSLAVVACHTPVPLLAALYDGEKDAHFQLQDGQYLRPSDPAYEQVLDSLAMVACHTPVPLIGWINRANISLAQIRTDGPGCLFKLVKHAAEFCPSSAQEAKLEIIQRLAHITLAELGGKAHPS
ncbi:hypothetical protein CQW23_05482 [Capsicum baccatum]|uniref:Cell morphogenesis central region domain-containing protein n=1 Tax=Capsicum baccatum TaxID=33114 RepID=A0A2G2XHM9_CAPBA|nr:hypothetical protein CQW23_05482 [Capsicum baccatum]